jgi:hypothetical protein
MTSGSRSTAGHIKAHARRRSTLVFVDGTDNRTQGFLSALQSKAPDAVTVDVTDFLLAEWRHSVNDHQSSWTAVLAGGTNLQSSEFETVITTVRELPATIVQHIATIDRHFAYDEMTAAMCSMLTTPPLRPFNMPVPPCIAGRPISENSWQDFASASGFATTTHPLDTPDVTKIVLIDGVPHNDAPIDSQCRTALRRMAQQLPDQRIIEIWFDARPPQPVFIWATTMPDMLALDQLTLDRVLACLV